MTDATTGPAAPPRPDLPAPAPRRARRRSRLEGYRLATLVAAGLVFVMIVREAPFYLPELPEAAPPVPDEPQLVFGYATLANPVIRTIVTGRWREAEPAALADMCRIGRDLAPDPGGLVEGRVFSVGPAELLRLDRFEETGLRYERALMPLADGREAWVYRMIPVAPMDGAANGACP